jgi:osmotically-inducible protein OsmY
MFVPFDFLTAKETFMKHLAISLSIMFAALATACAPTETSRGSGQVVEDASLTTRVKTKIAQTAGLGEAININVDTYKNVVSLAGFVDTPEQMRMALQAAQSVPGVESVRNNLELKPRTQQSQGSRPGTTSGR